MLESNQLLDNLLKLVAKDEKMLIQNLAFDILNWITVIRLTRYRSPIPTSCKWTAKNAAKNPNSAALDPNTQQEECVQIVSQNLADLIKFCMVLNNRSIAHKCIKMVLAVLDGAQNVLHGEVCQEFEAGLKKAIVDALPSIIKSEYAGALRWFTLLIAGTSSLDAQNEITEQSIKLLLDIAAEMVTRNNPHGLLLRSRFGLYGLPFEPELFDAELPSLSKTSNLVYTYVPASKPSGIQLGNQPMDLKSFCVSDGSEFKVLPFQLRRKGIGSHFKGALEVEPLHFICTATSEATRLENTDSTVIQSGHVIDDIMLDPPMNNLDTPHFAQAAGGSKKETDKDNLDDDIMNNVKNILVDKIFYSAIKKNKLKEDIKEAAKSFDLEVSVLSGFNEPETNDEWGPPEPRVVFLTNNSVDNSSETILEDASTTSASLTNKIQEFFEESNANEDTAFQWHKILSTPPKQTIVVDRMHSGARRYVTLDFGQPTMLTDLVSKNILNFFV